MPVTYALKNIFYIMLCIDINCDMGEGVSAEEFIMPFISSANIACGYHAGDEDIMKKTISLAMQHNVAIGAHPGFADKENFGRNEIQMSDEEYYLLIKEQLELIKKIADELGAKMHHIKPHGALYNMSAKNERLALIIAKAVKDFDDSLVLYGLSGSYSITEAKKIGLHTASEVFADRTYQDDATLTPRSSPNALIDNEAQCIQQLMQMVHEKCVTSVNNKKKSIVAETICIHGDGSHAIEFAKKINYTLQQQNIVIKAK
jgi:UPF0271 protein